MASSRWLKTLLEEASICAYVHPVVWEVRYKELKFSDIGCFRDALIDDVENLSSEDDTLIKAAVPNELMNIDKDELDNNTAYQKIESFLRSITWDYIPLPDLKTFYIHLQSGDSYYNLGLSNSEYEWSITNNEGGITLRDLVEAIHRIRPISSRLWSNYFSIAFEEYTGDYLKVELHI
jgi:hypothetical protein